MQFIMAQIFCLCLGVIVLNLLHKLGVQGFIHDGSLGSVLLGTLSFQGASWVLILIFLRQHQTGWREALGFRGPRLKHALLTAVGFIIVVLPVVLLLQAVSIHVLEKLGWPSEDEAAVKLRDGRQKSLWTTVYLGVFAVVIAPVAEEFVFRGMFYPYVKQLGSPRLAFFGVSALFAEIHFDMGTLMPLFVFALALTWLYEKTDNLLAPITAHALFNAANFGLLLHVQNRDKPIARKVESFASSDMNEFELIAKLTRALPVNESVVTGAGDDCAVLDLGMAEKLILFKTDAVVEGFHFTRETPPEKIRAQGARARLERHRCDGRNADRRAGVTIALPGLNFDAGN